MCLDPTSCTCATYRTLYMCSVPYQTRNLCSHTAAIPGATLRPAPSHVQELELALHRERERHGNTRTVQELKGMIGSLQAEVASLQQHIKLNKVRGQGRGRGGRAVLFRLAR